MAEAHSILAEHRKGAGGGGGGDLLQVGFLADFRLRSFKGHSLSLERHHEGLWPIPSRGNFRLKSFKGHSLERFMMPLDEESCDWKLILILIRRRGSA